VSQLKPFQPFVRSWNKCLVGDGFICDRVAALAHTVGNLSYYGWCTCNGTF